MRAQALAPPWAHASHEGRPTIWKGALRFCGPDSSAKWQAAYSPSQVGRRSADSGATQRGQVGIHWGERGSTSPAPGVWPMLLLANPSSLRLA
jgi:hypothetical protein